MSTAMATLLHSVSPLSTGKAVPERNRFKLKGCSFSHLPKNPIFTPKKSVSIISASTHKDISHKLLAFKLPDWKDKNNILKSKLLDAFFHFEKMVKKGYDPDQYQAQDLISDLSKERMFRKSVRVMDMVLRTETKPDEFTCTSMIEALTTVGALECALKLVDKMLERGLTLQTDCYYTLTSSFCRHVYHKTNPSWDHLEKLINKDVIPSNPSSFTALLDSVCLDRGVDEAISLMCKILEKDSCSANIGVYNVILNRLRKSNRIRDVLDLFKAIPPGVRPNLKSYNIVLNGLCREERFGDAESLLIEMIERKIFPDVTTYKLFIQVLAEKGYPEEALEIAKLLDQCGFKTDAGYFNPIIECFSLENRVDMVREVLEIMEKSRCYFNIGTYGAICVLCTQGNVIAAFDILQDIRKNQKTGFFEFYNKIFPSLCRRSSTIGVIQILSKLSRFGFIPDLAIIFNITTGLIRVGRLEEAMDLYEIREEKGFNLNVMNYNGLILGLSKAGRVDLALTVHEKMVSRGYKPDESTYVHIVEGIAYRDRRELAHELLRELVSREIVTLETCDRICLKFCLDDVLL